jgi:electron transport complex protein RnfG
MKNYIKSVGALTVICAVIAILLALTNSITAPIIEKNANAAANEALLIVLPDGEEFTSVDLSSYELPATVTEAFTEKNGGVVVKLTTSGYGSDMVIMVGIDGSGTVTGATCLSSNETLGYEKTYGENTVGATVDTVDGIDVIAGATKTTAAYKGAVKDALNTAVILGGGSVDVRTEEEILADNLNGALPEGEGEFESVFIAEAIDESITSVYKAVNFTGEVENYKEKINELLFAFSTDPGSLNTYKGYLISPEPDGANAETYMQEFADYGRKVVNGDVGTNGYIMVATDYGYHVMFYSEKYVAGFEYADLETYLNKECADLKGEFADWTAVLKDMQDNWDGYENTDNYLYTLYSSLVSTKISDLINKDYNDTINEYVYGEKSAVVKYEDRYADLLEG